MSHVASMELEIKDLECLEKAAKQLGLDVGSDAWMLPLE